MNKKINLALAAFLLGGIAGALPTLGKIIVFAGIALVLFVKYDEYEYTRRVGGAK